jgi:hypothetical protein
MGRMMSTLSRRTFCTVPLAAAALSVPAVLPAVTTAPTDSVILAAVDAWLRLEPVLTDLLRRRDDAFDASRALVGECPMGNADANHAWHRAWNETECGRLEWQWDRIARLSDDAMTMAVNTPARTPEGIAAKLRLYRATTAYFDERDDYFLERIERDIAALSIRGRA